MAIRIKTEDYTEYVVQVAAKIKTRREYISALGAATGDGEYWENLSKGFQMLVDHASELKKLFLSDMFNSIGINLMYSMIKGN